ncbi:L,D-transpeptidase [Streptomyces sp. NPDC054887]
MIRSSPTRHPARHRTRALLAGAATLTVALTACSAGGAGRADAAGRSGKAPEISVDLRGKHAEAGEPVRVKIAGGSLGSVTVRDARGGELTGTVSEDGKSWTSRRGAAPGTTYSVRAEDENGADARTRFTTTAPDKVNKLGLTPGNEATVGVAQPLSVVFDHPVKNKAAVEKRLRVTTSNGTEGSWGWLRDFSGRDRVDWRPKEYWKSGTRVSLDADLKGVDSGAAGGWFVRDYSTHFTVGERQIVKVDLDRHRLRLTRDGQTVKDVPMSAGTPGGDKASWRGTAVLMAKEGTINMRSETVGLGDAYDKMVDSSMRLTWSGMYAHAAPWNKAYLGKANKSSGCVGMSDEDAAWIYRHVHVGDPFEMTGDDAKGTVAANNGYGEWNLSWAEWQTKSALG